MKSLDEICILTSDGQLEIKYRKRCVFRLSLHHTRTLSYANVETVLETRCCIIWIESEQRAFRQNLQELNNNRWTLSMCLRLRLNYGEPTTFTNFFAALLDSFVLSS